MYLGFYTNRWQVYSLKCRKRQIRLVAYGLPERRAQTAADSIESVVSIERLFEKHSFSTASAGAFRAHRLFLPGGACSRPAVVV